MNREEEYKGKIQPIMELLKKEKMKISDAKDYKSYFRKDEDNPQDFKTEIYAIRNAHKNEAGVYIMWGDTGATIKAFIEESTHKQDSYKQNLHMEYEAGECIYIGKSSDIGQRVYDQFYSEVRSQILPNVKKSKDYSKIDLVNPRMLLENLDYTKFKNDALYITEIDLILFDNDAKGYAGRDICEILLIQETEDSPLLNNHFVYRESGNETKIPKIKLVRK
ncbi:hypothetical protein P4679_26365 [Priestia megaterium]|uniref:hypothetical protein n=1 Tax=Priestia megaterium TaxID=1404 RepID=UPI002E201130|nr:hypothetical protein [Priestia megaterium]